jgi:hypothetical protein
MEHNHLTSHVLRSAEPRMQPELNLTVSLAIYLQPLLLKVLPLYMVPVANVYIVYQAMSTTKTPRTRYRRTTTVSQATMTSMNFS